MNPSPAHIKELQKYLLETGFSGDIPQNNGHKNWLVIKRLMKNDPFYTFGIARIEQAVKHREVNAKQIRDIVIAASGVSIKRFRHSGPGHFDSAKVTDRLVQAIAEIQTRAKTHQSMIFATGHPGAMVGFVNGLAEWAESLGAKVVSLEEAIEVDERYKLDMIGSVMVPSDNCSAIHTHESRYMEELLSVQSADFVVADHGFTGAAINHGIEAIGFYDTDDPGMPLAESLGLPVLAVPINDNNYNANGATLARYLIERFGQNAPIKPRRSRTRAD